MSNKYEPHQRQYVLGWSIATHRITARDARDALELIAQFTNKDFALREAISTLEKIKRDAEEALLVDKQNGGDFK